jgi:hypothetical protein
MPLRPNVTLIIGAVSLGFFLSSSGAEAATPAASGSAKRPDGPTARAAKPNRAPVGSKLNLAELDKQLTSGDEALALQALASIETSGDPTAAPLVEAVLARGASPALLIRAIRTLGALRQASSGAALAPYTQHRQADLRRAALRALIATRSPIAPEVLRRALRGSDPAMRAIAAQGLGELEVHAAVPELFTVLSRDVSEAAQALGALCRAEECERFAGLLGKLRFDVMQSGMVPLLLRPELEVSDEIKLRVVERLRRLATQPALNLIQTALARFPAEGSAKVRDGMTRALKGHSVAELP